METAYVAVNGFIYREKTTLPRRFSPSGSLTFRRALFHRLFCLPCTFSFVPLSHISAYPVFRPAICLLFEDIFCDKSRDKVIYVFFI